MRLTTVEIQNYRSLFGDDENKNQLKLELADGLNTIVGPNNVGKSNIFRALAVALDPDYRFDRKKDMPAQAVWAKPTITLTFQIEGPRTSSEATLLRYLEAYEKAVNEKAKASFASKGIVRYRVVIEGGPDSVGARREGFLAAGAGGRVLQDDDPLLRKAVAQFGRCFHFVYIESGQSLSSLLEGKFRDILRSVLKEQLSAQYAEVEKARASYVQGIRTGLLEPLTGRIGAELKDLFPEILSVTLNPEVGDLEQTLTHMGVSVTDTAPTELAEKGTGVRGGVLVAILRHLADEGKRSMLFAVEEPEAFLHPAAQECLREDLEAIADLKPVSLLIATHSPFVVSRRPNSKIFCISKSALGRTVVSAEAAGDSPHAPTLGSLFRDRLVIDVLDRARSLPAGAKAILVVEGYTDERYLRTAARFVGDGRQLDEVAIVLAGAGYDAPAGGASMAVMQALVARSTSDLPVVALFDNDAEGNEAFKTLKKISVKTGDWTKGKNLLQYSDAIAGATSGGFEWEAEDLWPEKLMKDFVDASGENLVLTGKNKRPQPVGGWQYSINAASKASLADFLDKGVGAGDVTHWAQLITKIRDGAGI